jgi:2-methylisocitrate lyase-like PEP mutase family enzyme
VPSSRADAGVGRLRALHRGRPPGDPLVLPGPWDAASARVFAEAGFEALATPSHGVAAALGHEDGSTPADAMFAAVARIVAAVPEEVPVTADLEGGYGLAPAELVGRLLETGAVGCNLEDSRDGVLLDAERQAGHLAAVVAAAGGRIFLNARTDAYLRGSADPLAESVERGRLYAAAGAECVYPIGAPPGDLPVLARELDVPVNALCRPDGPSPGDLGAAGAGRVTFGGTLHERATEELRRTARALRAGRPGR